MNPNSIYPCGRINRRGFLTQAGGGFFGAALGALWAADGKIEGAHIGPHFPPKAKSVIFLFMCGGVSHIDTFDPKDNKYAGKLIDAIGFGDNVAEMKRPVIPMLRTFTRYGKSGIPVSDWFPNVGGVIDEIAVVRSMWCHEGNHFPAVIETTTGHRGRQFDHPTLGSWVSYALGTRQQESADVRQHRPRLVARAIDRRLPRRERLPRRRFSRARRRSRICIRRNPAAPPSATGRCSVLDEMNQEFRERYAINSRHRRRARRPTNWPRACSFTLPRWSISRRSRTT